MFILTNINDEIFNISETKGYQENGNYLMNGGMVGETAIPQNQVKGIFEMETIPEEVCEVKWCYTEERGFYENENHVEEKTQSQRIEELEKQVEELQNTISELQTQVANSK